MFLSLVVSLSFVFVSTKINQNLMYNMHLDDFFSKDTKITNLINSWSEWDVWDNEVIKNENISLSLTTWENLLFSFSWITEFTWSIRIKEWWPLYFETISYSWVMNNLELTTSSWLLWDSTIQSFTWYLTSIYTKSDLILKNLWGYSSFYLELNKSYIGTWTIKKSKITKDIWGKEVEKTIIEK